MRTRGGQDARPRPVARTELRIGRVQLQPPQSLRQVEPLSILAVQVLETDPPPGREPLEWLLLASYGQPTARDALRIAAHYENRWGIEEYFRVLKSGMRIEDRRLRTAESLGKCLAFDAIDAWRMFELDRYARDAPDTPVGEVLTPLQIYIVDTVTESEQLLPPPGDIRSYVMRLARLAGFRPSKRRPLPGNEILWRAWLSL